MKIKYFYYDGAVKILQNSSERDKTIIFPYGGGDVLRRWNFPEIQENVVYINGSHKERDFTFLSSKTDEQIYMLQKAVNEIKTINLGA